MMSNSSFPNLRNGKRKFLSALLLVTLVGSVLVSAAPNIFFMTIAEAQDYSPYCVFYDSLSQTIRIQCGDTTLPTISNTLNDSGLLKQESDKVWLLNADVVIENEASLYITSDDTSWLKLENPKAIRAYGDLVIDSVKITSWNSSIGDYATTDGQKPRSYITIWEGGIGQMNITNSEIAYLGYHTSHKQGLAWYSGHGSILINNEIHNLWYGFYSNNVGYMRIENNYIHDNAVYGLDPHTGTHDMVIRNNIVHTITKGIGIICSHDCYNILMENNIVYDVSSVGLMLSRNTVNSTIRNNIVYSSGTNGGGISVDDSSYNEVYNNTVSVGRYGIKISKNSDGNHVYDNKITDYSSYGICMIDGSSYNIVHDNKIRNVGEYGICTLRGGANNEIFSNQISEAGYYGIYVRDADAVNNVFKSNSISDSRQNAVRVFNNTASTFIDNTITGSTRTDYSLAGSKIMVYDTTFSSTYFDSSGRISNSEVNIVNSDGKMIVADKKLDNYVDEDGNVQVQLKLGDGERTALTTVPFVVRPYGSGLNLSVLGGSIDSKSPKLTWIENPTSQAEGTLVYHRMEGLNPGLSIQVTDNDLATISLDVVDHGGRIEFMTESAASGRTYSLQSFESSASGDNSDLVNIIDDHDDLPNLKTYGCAIYSGRVHCDQLMNDFTNYYVEGELKLVQPLSTSESVFEEGKFGKAVKLSAKYRESVEIMSTPAINSDKFSFSFWIRNSDEAEPYGHIVSHVNFAGTRGWFVDMTSTASQPFVQRLRLAVTNTQGQSFESAEVQVPQGRFVHVAGVFDGSTVKLYLGGNLAGETPFQGVFNPDSGTPLRIGSASYSASTHRWSGYVDDFMLFNRVLSEDEIKQISMETLAGGGYSGNNADGSGPIAHLAFENNMDDSSGNGSDGTQTTLLASMAFSPDGRLFYSEKNTGNIRIMKNDVILEEPFAQINDVYVGWEQGLLGLAVDSRFEENHYVYQYYTYMDPSTGEVYNRVVRFTDVNDRGTEMKVLLDKIPAVKGYHAGGALTFGPDDKLYITVGDATEHPFALDPNILTGKILRIDRDGSIPSDNPDPNSPIYAKGSRNSYGLAFDNNGLGIFTENGDVAYDEVNIISKGASYGFPIFQPANLPPELADPSTSTLPIRSYFETIAPTQTIYYKGEKIPELQDMFLFGSYNGKIYGVNIDPDSKQLVSEVRIDLYHDVFSPVIGIAQAPNGDVYYGSYGIFKLESIDASIKIPYIDSINVASSEDIQVKNLIFDQDRRRITIELSNKATASYHEVSIASDSFTQPSLVSIKIPRSLMDDLTAVMVEGDNRFLEYSVSRPIGPSSSSSYNIISFTVDDLEANSKVSVVASRIIPEFPIQQISLMLATFVLMTVAMALVGKLRQGYGGKA